MSVLRTTAWAATTDGPSVSVGTSGGVVARGHERLMVSRMSTTVSRRIIDVAVPRYGTKPVSRLCMDPADADLFRRLCKLTNRDQDDVFREMLALFVQASGLEPVYADVSVPATEERPHK